MENGETHVKLDLRDLGTLVRVTRKWIAEFEFLGLGREPTDELVVDALLHVYTRTGTTCLPVIPANGTFL